MKSENRRSRMFTLILLRPDGTNRTWQITPGLIRGAVIGGVAVLLVVGVSLAAALLFWRRYDHLQEKYQLVSGREILAVTPQPVPADRVPGAAERPEEPAGGAGGTADSPQEEEPSAGEEVPVRLEQFGVEPLDGGDWRLSVQLTKKEWDGELLRGYTAILIEDAARPGRFLTHPPLALREGRPAEPAEAESFAMRRLKPIEFEFGLPEGFRMREVRILVYDRSGDLMLERVFPVEGS
ncbi:MAG: hypothetical protein R6W82_03880 [bacterium]